MGVTDLSFLYIFLPAVILFYFVFKPVPLKNLTLLFFSLAFYAWGDFAWLSLLVVIAVLDYFSGVILGKQFNEKLRSFFFYSSVILRVGMLFGIKYIIEDKSVVSDDFLLWAHIPLGLSFYMFKSISYLSEIYLEQIPPSRKFLDYLLYISFFPTVIAGPIVRFSEMEDAIKLRKIEATGLSEGVIRISKGLIKKIVIADSLEPLVKQFLTLDAGSSWLSALFGLSIFSLQIYYDFSGYTDIALGTARIFGFSLPENFNYPYFSKSVSEFWRRWHITLGSFFRDFVFIPLTMMGTKFNIVISLFVVWALTGLWHGFSLNFLVWGLYFGVFIIAEIYLLKKLLEKLPGFFQHVYLLLVVFIGWSFFYFKNFDDLLLFYQIIFSLQEGSVFTNISFEQAVTRFAPLIAVALLLAFPVKSVFMNRFDKWSEKYPLIDYSLRIVLSLAALFITTALLLDRNYNAFLYGGF